MFAERKKEVKERERVLVRRREKASEEEHSVDFCLNFFLFRLI